MHYLLDVWALEQQVCDRTHNLSLCLPFFLLAYQLGSRRKQADGSVEPVPNPSALPSIVLEVGSSDSLTQLKIDASLWLETAAEVS